MGHPFCSVPHVLLLVPAADSGNGHIQHMPMQMHAWDALTDIHHLLDLTALWLTCMLVMRQPL